MISRRRILSMSPSRYEQPEEEEDVWHQKDVLFKDHIQEVLTKWNQIDDEIWAKVIVLEKNRRLAKAYARAPVLTINGSDYGFDGFRIGLNGFDNPVRDAKTEDLKRHIGHGVKIKMDDAGNILIKRVSMNNIYIKSTGIDEESAIGNDIIRSPKCALEFDKPVKLFDMKKFHLNVNRELRQSYPNRRRLEYQCLTAICFLKQEQEVLDCPVWVLIINLVAMDLLKSKLSPYERVVDIKNRPLVPTPDEDPYSLPKNGSAGFFDKKFPQAFVKHPLKQSEKPPKLPPREKFQPHHIPKPDYDDEKEEQQQHKTKSKLFSSRKKEKADKTKDHKYEDLYYCGLRARVSKSAKTKDSVSSKKYHPPPQQHQSMMQQHYGNGQHYFQNSMSQKDYIYGVLSFNNRNCY